MSPGTDYAIRVQEFKANFHGDLTDNLKWYLDTFGINKSGERSADTVSHCFPASASLIYPAAEPTTPAGYGSGVSSANQCHAVSQAQHIDWTTTEVVPGFVFRLGDLTLSIIH